MSVSWNRKPCVSIRTSDLLRGPVPAYLYALSRPVCTSLITSAYESPSRSLTCLIFSILSILFSIVGVPLLFDIRCCHPVLSKLIRASLLSFPLHVRVHFLSADHEPSASVQERRQVATLGYPVYAFGMAINFAAVGSVYPLTGNVSNILCPFPIWLLRVTYMVNRTNDPSTCPDCRTNSCLLPCASPKKTSHHSTFRSSCQ
jgi:hypothetical protein